MRLLLALLAASPAPLTTVAEQSGFTRTGRYAEVESLCAAFAARSPKQVRCETFGTTPLGRPMKVLVASADGAFTPEENRAKGRPVLLFQGGIHAGEIDGKDAGFWLLRELLDGRVDPGVLAKVTLVFVPVFNVDGHERFSKNNRPNQVGPEEMGWRVTSQNLNLNRDYAKADSPEMAAMLKLLTRWDPILYADLHVTDGAKFQPDVAVTFEPQHLGPQAFRVLGQGLKVGLFAKLEAQGHQPLEFYPSFVKEDDPLSGFALGWPPPRFGNAYWTARDRIGVLVETHSWKDYATRVKTTFDVCAGLLALAAEDGPRWLKAAHAAELETAGLAGKQVTLLFEAAKQPKTIDFPGYAYTTEPSSVSGRPWVRYDDHTPQVWKVPFYDELKPSLTVTAPRGGYLVPPPNAAWVAEKLKLHGLQFHTLTAATGEVPVEQFKVEPTFRPTPSEGHQVLTAKGQWSDATRSLPAGTLFVPIAQPHATLALFLFEPTSPDSFVAWGFFNAYLEQKEYLEDYVTEPFARELLEDPKVKAEFEARLKDEAFAKSPQARLRFFSERHPSADANLNVPPVYRTAATY